MQSANKNNVNQYSSNFIELLTLMFIYLKLTGQITWSWWWVLSPIWIALLVVFVIVLIAGLWVYYNGK